MIPAFRQEAGIDALLNYRLPPSGLGGTYVLIMRLDYKVKLHAAGIRDLSLAEGIYAYVGSALRGIRERVLRHLRKRKRLHWHVDYLLAEARALAVAYCVSDRRTECEVARRLSRQLVCIKGFGSSDCSCKGHLFRSDDLSIMASGVLSGLREVHPGSVVDLLLLEPLARRLK